MPRPFPVHPRGIRKPPPRRERLLLACPRVSPEWEIAALRALVKPQTKGAVEHRTGLQRWPRNGSQIVGEVCPLIAGRLNATFEPHLPDAGEYHFLLHAPADQAAALRALALSLSARLPSLWFVLGRLFVHNGRFFRRRFGYRLELRPATNVHLPRDVRAAVKDLL